MATTYLLGAVRPANPSRRAFIGAASLALPLAAATAASPLISSTNREWDRLVAECHRADAAQNTANKVHDAAETVYFAERKALGERPASPDSDYPRPIRDMTIGELRDYAPSPEQQAQYTAVLAEWQAKSDQLEEEYKHGAGGDWTDAIDAREDAVTAIFAYPAPDRAALLFKLELAEREYHGLGIDLDAPIARQIFADVRRFARGEA
jgi:hypothetical protein